MNKYKFIDYLHHPKKVTEEQEAKLLEVVDDYPYFQTARTLVAKVRSDKKDPAAKKYIGSASLYVFDRAFFRKYITEDLFIIEPKKASESRLKEAAQQAEVSRKVTTKRDPLPPSRKARSESQKLAASRPKPSPKQETPQKQPPKAKEPQAPEVKSTQDARVEEKLETLTPPTKSSLDLLIEEVYQDMADLRKSKARFIEWQEKNDMEEAVEKAMAASAEKVKEPEEDSIAKLADSKEEKQEPTREPDKLHEVKGANETSVKEAVPVIPKEKDTPPTEDPKEEDKVVDKDPKPQTKKPVATKDTTVDKEVDEPAKKPAPKKAAKAPAKKAAASTSKKTTTAKTKSTPSKPEKKTTKASNKAKKTTTTKKTTATKSKTSTASKAKDGIKAKASTADKKTVEDATSAPAIKKEEKEEIIDQFIKSSPSITKLATDDGIPTDDLSKKSTRFHADIASEYLAEIYIEQGKSQRAIDIYENLCLKFPEKKSYFAGLIEKLKK